MPAPPAPPAPSKAEREKVQLWDRGHFGEILSAPTCPSCPICPVFGFLRQAWDMLWRFLALRRAWYIMIRDSVVVPASLHCLGCLNFDSLDWRIFMIRGGAESLCEVWLACSFVRKDSVAWGVEGVSSALRSKRDAQDRSQAPGLEHRSDCNAIMLQ